VEIGLGSFFNLIELGEMSGREENEKKLVQM
jgi:hypothetical protein